MAVPNIQVTFTEARSTVAHYLGYMPRDGDVTADIDASELVDVDTACNNGFRLACYPPILEKEDEMHEWTFLVRHQELAINMGYYYSASQATVLIQPPIHDFEGVIRRAVLRGGSDNNPLTKWIKLRVVSEGQLEQLVAQNPQEVGTPRYICPVKLQESSPDVYEYQDSGQQYRLRLWPGPEVPTSETFTLYLDYPIAPTLWSSTDIYPPGGPKHGRMFLQACLAEAELIKNDGHRVHYERFLEYLKHSVGIDRREKADFEREHNWPIAADDQPETLNVTYNDLLRECGLVAGYGANPALYDHEQRSTAEYVVRRAYQRFLKAHVWKFMLNEVDIGSVNQGNSLIEVTSTFTGQTFDNFVYADGLFENKRAFRVPIVPLERIRAIEAKYTTTSQPIGAPKYIAFVAQHPDQISQPDVHRWLSYVFPTPDRDYSLAARILQMPPPMSEGQPYPIGGALHGETIAQCVRAQAEQYVLRVANGPEEQKFLACLASSIEMDKQAMATETQGTWPNELDNEDLETDPSTSSAPGYNVLTLKRDIGLYIGLGANPQEWSHPENGMVESYMHEGYRDFVYPVILPGVQRQNYRWRFLTRRKMFQIEPVEEIGWGGSEAAQTDWIERHTYQVPGDFSGSLDSMEFVYGGNIQNGMDEIRHVPEAYVKRLRAENPTRTGPPQMYYILQNSQQAAEIDGNGMASLTNSSSSRVAFWPDPDQTYWLEHVYQMDPYPLSGDTCVPLGSPLHANCILSLCLAAVEMRHQHISNGPMYLKAMRQLESAIRKDMTDTGPTHYGRNTEPCYDPYGGTRLLRDDYAVIRLNGEEL